MVKAVSASVAGKINRGKGSSNAFEKTCTTLSCTRLADLALLATGRKNVCCKLRRRHSYHRLPDVLEPLLDRWCTEAGVIICVVGGVEIQQKDISSQCVWRLALIPRWAERRPGGAQV